MKKHHIYGIGAALVDTEIQVNDADLTSIGVEKGVMTLIDEQKQTEIIRSLETHLVHCKRASGGSGANTIIAAQYFGSSCFYSCRVANDDNGAFFLEDLRQAGVQSHIHNGRNDGITGKCLVMITDDAERSMCTFLGSSGEVSVDDIDSEAISASEYVYLEGYLVSSASGLPAAIKVREIAQQHGVKVSLSLSDPAMVAFFEDGLKQMIGSRVDLLFCNESEALNFTKTEDLNAASEALKKYADTFAITLGERGALIFDGTAQTHISGSTVKAIDTNGAGDMFAGAFLHAITHGKRYEEAGAFANAAAAMVVSQYGPRLEPEQYASLM